MLTGQELAKHLRESAARSVSIEEFEEWFDSNSWNVHKQRNQGLVDAVFQVEELFSAYADGRIDESSLRQSFDEIGRELHSHESVLNEEPYALAELHDFTLEFEFTEEGLRDQEVPRAPRWFPVAGSVHDEYLDFGA